jgi:signal recognition particle GTPase
MANDSQIKSRVIVDATTFGEARPTRRILLNVAGRIKTNANELSKLSAEDFLICHYLAPGFSLTEKRWCLLQVDRIVEVVYNSSAFDCLLLPDAQKQMIHSMVKVHTDPRLSFDDIIAGKGKGMVALLHGEPGVGKTLTAGISSNLFQLYPSFLDGC